jgi:hypothetical protein
MVSDWDCIVRNLLRVADGRVRPVHDAGANVGIFGAWYYTGTVLRRAAATIARSAVAATEAAMLLRGDDICGPIADVAIA